MARSSYFQMVFLPLSALIGAVIALWYFIPQAPVVPVVLESNVLVIGSSGAGKSSLIRNAFGYSDVDSGFSAVPITNQSTIYSFPAFQYHETKQTAFQFNAKIIDTIGFGATDPLENIVKEIRAVAAFLPTIDYILVVLKAERNNPVAFRELGQMMEMLQCWGAKKSNLIVYITHGDLYSDNIQSKIVSGVYDYFKSVVDVQPEIASFALLDEIHKDIRSIYEVKLEVSKKKLFKRLSEKAKNPLMQPFSPLSHYLEWQQCYLVCADDDCKDRCKCTHVFAHA